MNQLIIQIIAGLIVLIIAGWLGLSGNSVRIINANSTTPSRSWVWVKLFLVLMIIGGIYLFSSNKGSLYNLTANNVYAYMGLSFIGIGFIGLGIVKFIRWLIR